MKDPFLTWHKAGLRKSQVSGEATGQELILFLREGTLQHMTSMFTATLPRDFFEKMYRMGNCVLDDSVVGPVFFQNYLTLTLRTKI